MSEEQYKRIFSKNLKRLMSANGKEQTDLINDLGFNKSAVSTWYNGKRLPRMDKVDILARYFGVKRSDLIEDHHSSLNSELNYATTSTPEEFETLIKPYRALDPHGKETVDYILDRETERTREQAEITRERKEQAEHIQELNKNIQELEKNIQELEEVPANIVEFPRPDTAISIYTYMHKIASAGVGFYFDDIPTETIQAPYKEKADFIIGVNGDSMTPTFSDGDLVYVQKCPDVKTGEIGIFFVDGECFIKEAGESGLVSHNPSYPMIKSENVMCVGRVLGKVDGGYRIVSG